MSKPNLFKPAKLCYGHIGGKLGSLLVTSFLEKGWIAKDDPDDKHLYITSKGEKEFQKLGIDISQIGSEKA
ncbi:ArsR family transcriptional regulator [Leptospira sarikeiensis]|uniref:ArsR family transcriptional regulator n=1 Tax=Leptospira sarikeiensis TaxID=2484943 RepID=A0A4R9KA14_9LEPT|nr:ArsR family transcriptional regulator [Leptospira sarikeiensis]TGL61604.1 ArsR family transcriptional regulator [Leptospira sarikeiensis]